jgi:hypothetical protein
MRRERRGRLWQVGLTHASSERNAGQPNMERTAMEQHESGPILFGHVVVSATLLQSADQ